MIRCNCFNPSQVGYKRGIFIGLIATFPGFNPSQVGYKLGTAWCWENRECEFQSLTGRLQTENRYNVPVEALKFQSLTGRLQTCNRDNGMALIAA